MYKALIVDDEMIVRHAVKTLIRWEECRFEYAGSAANGRAALQMVDETGADLVITDIKMPEMDGIELIRALKAGGYDGEVLVLSNYNDFELVREALKIGAHDYMLKLTLNTDSFMPILEEVADKLDKKKRKRPKLPARRQPARAGEIRSALAEMYREASAPVDELPSAAAEKAALLLPEEERVMVFLVRAAEGQPSSPQSDLMESFQNLSGDLFAGSLWRHAMRTEDSFYLLAAAFPPDRAPARGDDLASRMGSLARMYYNVRTGIVYAGPAGSGAELARHIRLVRQAAPLLFYRAAERGMAADGPPAEEGDARFGQEEQALRGEIAGARNGCAERWADAALRLVEAAAACRLHPHVLKRALGGSLTQLAKALALEGRSEWVEAAWPKRIAASGSEEELASVLADAARQAAILSASEPKAGAMRDEVRRALRYLEDHYAERIAIADIARTVNLSETYLCQIFKAETGKSIMTYLNEIRMQRAYDLLASGRYLVKEAACEVGIHDPFYFNRLFKRRFGMPPKNVRPQAGSGKPV
jgi:AraC-like DNA-binding protein/DNA-binding NarL/FixJ family response regulator